MEERQAAVLNVVIAGVGGQGSVLAAKILAQAATAKGWQVRTAETIGMAQRGGNVTSHVRMGDMGEEVHAPLVVQGTADCVIALEPGEGLRALPYLSPDGLLVSAKTPLASVVANLSGDRYDVDRVLAHLETAAPRCVLVDDVALCQAAGSRKALNVGMLAAAVGASDDEGRFALGSLSVDDVKAALTACVKPQFLDMNLAAIDAQLR